MYTPLLLAFLAGGFICQTFAHTLTLYPTPQSLDCQSGTAPFSDICLHCSPGTFSSSGEICSPCTNNTFSLVGAHACTPCHAGAVSVRGASGCTPQDRHLVGFSEKNNGCITFNVTAGTGCAWMCDYCANQLGTTNYYFTDGVCTYQYGGCVSNPIASKEYTCCAA